MLDDNVDLDIEICNKLVSYILTFETPCKNFCCEKAKQFALCCVKQYSCQF